MFRRYFPAVFAVALLVVAGACGTKKSFLQYLKATPSWQQADQPTDEAAESAVDADTADAAQ